MIIRTAKQPDNASVRRPIIPRFRGIIILHPALSQAFRQ